MHRVSWMEFPYIDGFVFRSKTRNIRNQCHRAHNFLVFIYDVFDFIYVQHQQKQWQMPNMHYSARQPVAGMKGVICSQMDVR